LWTVVKVILPSSRLTCLASLLTALSHFVWEPVIA
jgi:hypothetical protein